MRKASASPHLGSLECSSHYHMRPHVQKRFNRIRFIFSRSIFLCVCVSVGRMFRRFSLLLYWINVSFGLLIQLKNEKKMNKNWVENDAENADSLEYILFAKQPSNNIRWQWRLSDDVGIILCILIHSFFFFCVSHEIFSSRMFIAESAKMKIK